MKYSMKRIIIIFLAVAFAINASAQSTLDDGIKMYNYKKYQTAQGILEPLAANDPQANYYLGLVYIEQGSLQKANTAFLRYPDDPG